MSRTPYTPDAKERPSGDERRGVKGHPDRARALLAATTGAALFLHKIIQYTPGTPT